MRQQVGKNDVELPGQQQIGNKNHCYEQPHKFSPAGIAL